MSALAASIALEAARAVGAPILKRLLERKLGKSGGAAIGGVVDSVLDAVTDRVGKPLESAEPKEVEKAVKAVEASHGPEFAKMALEAQEAAHELQLAEMKQGTTWTWAWRPGTMWLLAFLWLYTFVIAHIANAVFRIALPTDAGTLFQVTAVYMTLYMGGHTMKEVARGWQR